MGKQSAKPKHTHRFCVGGPKSTFFSDHYYFGGNRHKEKTKTKRKKEFQLVIFLDGRKYRFYFCKFIRNVRVGKGFCLFTTIL